MGTILELGILTAAALFSENITASVPTSVIDGVLNKLEIADYSGLEVTDCLDENGNNSYQIISFASCDKLAVIEKETGEVKFVCDKLSRQDIFDNEYFVYKDQNLFLYNLSDYEYRHIFSRDENNELTREVQSNFTYDRYYTISNDAVLIDNYFYFEKLHGAHGYNDGHVCGVIAGEILLGYYDTFLNDNIVPEQYDVEGDSNSTSTLLSTWPQSPGTGNNSEYDADGNAFKNELIVAATNGNAGISPTLNGMSALMVKNMLSQYLGSNFIYSINRYYNNDIKSAIENAINNNRPVIAEGQEHFVVAFGYDEDNVYVHTGWGFTATTPWSTFTDQQSILNRSAIDISFAGTQHAHSDNYYHIQSQSYYCGCGQSYYKKLIINPEDWGFPGAYNFNPILANPIISNVELSTKRLRTGYIEESFINLSPRRQNAGGAYLEVTISNIIKDMDVELAWWSQNEHQDDGYALFGYETMGTFYNSYVNLHDLNLPTRNNIQYYHFSLPQEDEPHGFAFYLSNLAVGDRNLGRLSIGTMSIKYAI